MECNVCEFTKGKLTYEINNLSKRTHVSVRFYYDPLVYIERHLTACLEDGNLMINADIENAIKGCFSENSIQMFYNLDGKEKKVKLGSNNILQKNIKTKKNLHFKLKNEGQTNKFEINNKESCAVKAKIGKIEDEDEDEDEDENDQLSVIGIVIGSSVCFGKASFRKPLSF